MDQGVQLVGLVAGQEVHEQRELVKSQFLPPRRASSTISEELLGLGRLQEVFLVRRALVGVARRDGDAVARRWPSCRRRRRPDALGVGALEQGACWSVTRKPGLTPPGCPRRPRRTSPSRQTAKSCVVLSAVHVDADQVRYLLGSNSSSFAFSSSALVQRYMYFLRATSPRRSLACPGAAAARRRGWRPSGRRTRRSPRSTARSDRLCFRIVRRVLDLAAAGAGQVAAEQRLQHQHQRVALHARNALLHHIGADPGRLLQGKAHAALLSMPHPIGRGGGKPRRWARG